MTELYKIIAYCAVLFVAIVGLIAAGYTQGEKHSEEIYAASELRAQQTADAQNETWNKRLNAAQLTHAQELDALKDIALKPFAVSVQRIIRVPKSPAIVHLSTTAAAPGSASTAAGPVVCASVVPESPDTVRIDFNNAQRADQLAADYRLLYNSWPTPNPNDKGIKK